MHKEFQARLRWPTSSEASATGCGAFLALCVLSGLVTVRPSTGQAASFDTQPITARHANRTREIAAGRPRRENDQVVVDGWPMYRTNRGQEAFNQAMATLRATEGAPPPARLLQGCAYLKCPVTLPRLSARGWIPAGRLWVSPNDYVLIVHSPRRSKYDPGRR